MANSPFSTIVVVNDNAFIQGGAAKVAINEAVGLAQRGYRVIFFAASGPADVTMAGVPNLEVIAVRENYDITKLPTLTYAVRGLWDREVEARFDQLLGSLNPKDALVHFHMVREQLTASVYQPALARKFPILVTPHEYNIGCPYGGFFDYTQKKVCPLVGMSGECRKSRCNNGAYFRKLWFYQKGKIQRDRAGVPSRIKHWAFISEFLRQRLDPYLAPGSIWHSVRNPIEASNTGARQVTSDAPFVFVGRLTVEKDPVTFAKAAREIGTRAVFIGDGDQKGAILAVNPDAELLGWKGREEVRDWMTKARALVFPSIWYEGAPLTVQEAEAVGLPTITSDACAARDYVREGETGRIFRAGDVSQLADIMLEFQDDTYAQGMSDRAHARFWSDPPTLESHIIELENVFQKVAADA